MPLTLGTSVLTVYRLLDDGKVDGSFGSGNQRAEIGVGQNDEMGGMVVLPDDSSVLALTQAGRSSISLYRLFADGLRDGRFGTRGGYTPLDLSSTSEESVCHLSRDASGHLLLLCHLPGDEEEVAILRLTPAGRLDASWGGSGVVRTRLGTEASRPLQVLSLPDDRVLVLAQGGQEGDAQRPCLLRRFEWSGEVDASFGEDGLVVVDLPGAVSEPQGVLATADRLWLAGNTPSGSAPEGGWLARLHGGEPRPTPALEILRQPKDQTLSLLEPLTLSVQMAGTGAHYYSWFRNGMLVASGVQPEYRVLHAAGIDEGEYRVEIRQGRHVTSSRVATVTVHQAPLLQGLSENAWTFEGMPLQITRVLLGRKPLTVRWFKDDVEIRSQTLASGPATVTGDRVDLLLPAATLSDAGDYHLVASNADGTLVSPLIRVEVHTDPSISLTADQVVAVGGALELAPSVNSSSDFQLQWHKNGRAIPGAVESSFQLESARMADAGQYTLRLRNSRGRATSAPMRISVVDVAARTHWGWLGRRCSLRVSVQDYGARYQWYREDQPLQDGNGLKGTDSPALTFTSVSQRDAGEYFCVIEQGSAQVTTELQSLVVVTRPPEFIAPDLPPAEVGTLYQASVPLSADVADLQIQGLPPGLAYSFQEARIVGIPHRAGRFTITLTALNPAGESVPTRRTLVVAPLPSRHAGRFHALLNASPQEAAASLDLTVASTGTYTGRLRYCNLQGALLTLSFKGALQRDPERQALEHAGQIALAKAPADLPAGLRLLQLQLRDAEIRVSSVASPTAYFFAGFACPWKSRNPLPAALPGRYNLAWEIPAGSSPEGHAFAQARLTAGGDLTLAGRLTDDSTFTLSAPVHEQLGCLPYAPLYRGRGALTGGFQCFAGEDGPLYLESGLSGDLQWIKRLPEVASPKILPRAFSVRLPGLLGGKYLPPKIGEVSGPRVMNSPSGPENLEVSLFGVEGFPRLTLLENQRVALPAASVPSLTALGFNAASGLVEGRVVFTTAEETYVPELDLFETTWLNHPYPLRGLIVRDPASRTGHALGFSFRPVRQVRPGQPPFYLATPTTVSLAPVEP